MSAPSFYLVVDALDRLDALPAHMDGRQNGRRRLMVRCPAHADRSPSLSVEHKGDRTLVHCFAGCETEAVLEALGLGLADLYDERRNGRVPSASAPKGSGTVAPGTSGRRAENEPGFNTRKFKVLDVAKMVAEV